MPWIQLHGMDPCQSRGQFWWSRGQRTLCRYPPALTLAAALLITPDHEHLIIYTVNSELGQHCRLSQAGNMFDMDEKYNWSQKRETNQFHNFYPILDIFNS